MKLNNLHPNYELEPHKVSQYISKVTSVVATLQEISTHKRSLISTICQEATIKQKVHSFQQPSALPYRVKLDTEALFANGVVWAWIEKIVKVTNTIAVAPVAAQSALSRFAKFLLWLTPSTKFSLLIAGKMTQLSANTKLDKLKHLQKLQKHLTTDWRNL
ncbi:MAG: hypothetical protein KME23_20645 [Goleter apudmare HA4340-LM2]|jgi:hypothetical protein|nr:hypothetical protein [Goleter apudmare HA4340-LM2]